MFLIFAYNVLTFIFIIVAFQTVNDHNPVLIWLLRLAIVARFLLSVIAVPGLFFGNVHRWLIMAFNCCLLTLPFYAFCFLPTYGIPFIATLLVLWLTKWAISKDLTNDYFMRYTTPYRIVCAGVLWLPLISFMMLAFFLATIPATSSIFPIGQGAVHI